SIPINTLFPYTTLFRSSYTLPTGCFTTTVITVNPLPATISGSLNVCVGATVTLTDGSSGGAWSSSNTGQAAIGSASGSMTGVSRSEEHTSELQSLRHLV